jgi:hypothetical protein
MLSLKLSIYEGYEGVLVTRWMRVNHLHRIDGPASVRMFKTGNKSMWWYTDGKALRSSFRSGTISFMSKGI